MASAVRDRAAIGAPPRFSPWAFVAITLLLSILLVIAVEMFLLLQQMRQLERALPTSTPSTTQLDAMRSDLDRMQPELHQVNVHLDKVQGNTNNIDPSLRDLAASVARLDTDMTQLLSVLRDVDQHVASIDRKTGPGLPLH